MRICVWRTGHEIADTVADAIATGLPQAMRADLSQYNPIECSQADVDIGYGILRGMGDLFKNSSKLGDKYIHLDRGYFRPNHYDGYYRISLNGTQQTVHIGALTPDYGRLHALGIELMPWRGFDWEKPILVCPPTQHVLDFFNCQPENYRPHPILAKAPGKLPKTVIRHKGETSPISFADYNYVYTFNSSVGWQALAAGIPCISDPMHSIVGAWFKDAKLTADLASRQHNEREKLFGVMANLQLTLDEMRAGAIWDLVNRLISTSDMTDAKPNAVTSLPTAS